MDPAVTPTPLSMVARAAAAFAAYRDGDVARMSELVELLTPILWHTARAQRADAATAEDVVQTAWLQLVDRAHTIEDAQAVVKWLMTTVRREAWRQVRQGYRDEPVEDVGVWEGAGSTDDDPAEVSLLEERRQLLWTHLRALPERCRELLRVIAFLDRPDYAALGQALAMPIGSIGPTRGRCLQRLRTALLADSRWSV